MDYPSADDEVAGDLPMGFSSYFLLAIAFFDLILAYAVLQRTRHYHVGRNFAWCLVIVAAWICCCAILLYPGMGYTISLQAIRATFFVGAGFGVSWLWFCADFPYTTRRFPLLAMGLTVLAIPWLPLSWTSLLIVNLSAPPWWKHAVPGVFTPYYSLWLSTCMLAGFLHLWQKRKEARGHERLQILYMLSGFLLSFGVVFTVNLTLPIMTHASPYAHWGVWASLFFTTGTSYAIIRYRLLEVNILLRALLINILSMLLLTGAGVLLLVCGTSQLPVHFQLSRQVLFGEIFVVTLLFLPLQRLLQQQLNRFFLVRTPANRRLRAAVSTLATLHDAETLLQQLATTLSNVLEARAVAIYLLDDAGMLCRQLTTAPWEEVPEQMMMDDALPAAACSGIIRW